MNNQYVRSLKWVLQLQWRVSKASLIWSLFSSIYSGLKPLVSTFALAKLVSSVGSAALQGADPNQVYLWLIVLLVIELATQAVNNIDSVAKTRYEQQMDLATNEQFFRKMYSLSQEQFDDEVFNTKLDRAREGLNQVWRVLQELSWAASTVISFVGSIAAILVVSPPIGLLIIVTGIPITIIQIKQNKTREKLYRSIEPYDRVAYRSRWMLIDPNFMPEIRLMNAFSQIVASWKKNMTKSYNKLHENNILQARQSALAEATQPLVSFGANIYFFKLLLAGTIGLDRFIFLRGMLEQSSSGTAMVASSVQRLHEMAISLQNFNEIFDTEPAIKNGEVKVNQPLTIEFDKVSFAYPGTNQNVLKDISFKISPGTKLALVGENGAGKSTLIKLLLRQYLPTSGTITVNGTNISEIEPESYYAAISNLSQEFLVVQHLSIRDNLLMGLSGKITDKQIYETTDLVDSTNMIKKLPHQLDSRLDNSFDDGTNLSGGQKQRLGVARALLRKGDILILDEPTSAIDAKAEYLIFNNIYKAHADRTTLIVSHRFSTVRKADSIIVMENGKITEYGTHQELLDHGGLYKEMFEAQAEGYR